MYVDWAGTSTRVTAIDHPGWWQDLAWHPANHYSDVTIDAMASQITGASIVDWIVSSCADQRKHQSSPSLAFARGIHRSPVNSPHKRPVTRKMFHLMTSSYCPACRTTLVAKQDFEWRWSVPLFKGLTVLEFSFILFDLCLLITFFNFIMNYVPIVTFWIFTYHKIWILSIMFCFIWSYWIIYFLACLEVSWRVVS